MHISTSKRQLAFAACITLALGALPSSIRAATSPDELCTGDPCEIDDAVEVEDGSMLDFGDRSLVLDGVFEVGSGSVTIVARDFTMESKGQVRGTGGNETPAGRVTIRTQGDIVIDSTRNGGAFRMNGHSAGHLTLVSQTGSIRGSGKIIMNNNSSDASGGQLKLHAGQDIDLSGDVFMRGGRDASGGSLEANAAGLIKLVGGIDADGGGSSLAMSAGGDITLRDLKTDGSGPGYAASDIELTSGGNVTVSGKIYARGSDSEVECGDGGSVSIEASGTISIQDELSTIASAGYCRAGDVDLSGRDIHIEKRIESAGRGGDTAGANVSLVATNSIVVNAPVRTDGGELGAGSIEIDAEGDVDILNNLVAQGRRTASDGNDVHIQAGGSLKLDATVLANGGSLGEGGDVLLSGCSLQVGAGRITTEGSKVGGIDLFVRGSASVSGNLQGKTAIHLSAGAEEPNLEGAAFTDDPEISHEWQLQGCDG